MTKRMLVWGVRPLACAIAIALALGATACNTEKAAAIKTMASQLVDATLQIEAELTKYWKYSQPEWKDHDEDSLYLQFATHLASNRQAVIDGSGKFDEQSIREVLGGTVREINATRSAPKIPWMGAVKKMQTKAEAIKEAVAELDQGSYLAGNAVASMEKHLLSMAGDLWEIHEHVREGEEAKHQANIEDAAYFDVALDTILNKVKKSEIPPDVLAGVIKDALATGFDYQENRQEALDQALGRIVLTADLSLKMADAAKNYKRVEWSQLMNYVRDLAAVASELELPAKYQAKVEEGVAAIKKAKDRIDAVREEAAL